MEYMESDMQINTILESSMASKRDCEKVHFYEQNRLTFFYLTFYCASFHEIAFELEQQESPQYKSPKDHPGVFKFETSKDGTIFCTFKLESSILEGLSYYEPYSTEFSLPEDSRIAYKISINKISDTHFSITMENPYDIKIDGLPGTLNDVFFLENENLTFVRTFSFTKNENNEIPQAAPPAPKPTVTNALKTFVKNTVEKSLQEMIEEQQITALSLTPKNPKSLSDQAGAAVEALKAVASDVEDSSSTISSGISSLKSAPEIAGSEEIKKGEKQKLLLELQNILFKNEYTDVILKACNGIELETYRCILAAHSPTFKSIFDFTDELPV
uniref:BTB domain-containing protein n=1 Tax=Panagrolaimus sp. ES5 TaxID=591445 RepID=A0AC34FUI2_9BILA